MSDQLRLLCVLAHPDDESLATGGILAKYADEGIATSLIMATRGERGWAGDPAHYPGPQRLGQLRAAELRRAARVLGLTRIIFLDYLDGELDRAEPAEVIGALALHIRRLKPDVVVTFDPHGYYGHPDHVAISQHTTAAVVAAADASYAPAALYEAHRVAKLYYFAPSQEAVQTYQQAFGTLEMRIDGMERRATSWADWAITTRIDATEQWRRVWEAVSCHRTQLPNYQALELLPEEAHRRLWGAQTFYRAMSLINGGRGAEADLFAGLR